VDELPGGLDLPPLEVRPYVPSASVMLSREAVDGYEVLMGHRISELPAFPDLWSFPGGGVSRVDRRTADSHPEWLAERGADRLSAFTLLREMIEEVGITPDGKGGFTEVDDEVRGIVCRNKSGWLEVAESGRISTSGFDCHVITERITPPQSPTRFHNLFFHVALGDSGAEPSFPPSRSEFDEFRWWRPKDIISSWERNELHIPPPIVTIFRDLIELMRDEDLMSACQVMSEDPPSGPHRFEYGPGVECILIPTDTLPPSTHTNCFILGERGGERLIVDPAIRDQNGFDLLRLKVEEIRADGSNVVATIFTHRHQDHLGDLEMIEQIYHAPVWASKETLETLPLGGQRKTIGDGESIEIQGPSGGSVWEVMETPGHCPGQICLVGEPGILSADNCTMVGTILVPSSDGNMGAYIQGLERLKEMGAHTLFPGHGPLIPNPERILSLYIKHRKARHEKVFEAIESGARSLSEISGRAYSDTPDAHPLLAKDQTLSHLKDLVNSGRVSNAEDRYETA